MTQVAVLVPGIMGSELRLGEEVVWPGPFKSLILAYKKMDKLMRDDLVAHDVIRNYTVLSEQYQAAINDLGRCGFRETDSPPTLFVCAYDWRQSIPRAAETLAGKLDEVVAAHGAGVEISLVAHSMGGLVSRYYLESGNYDKRKGHGRVRRLLTLGTPHRGAPLALMAALGKEKRLWLSAAQVKQLCSDDRFPSLYQLLPPPGEPFAWDDSAASEFSSVDIYDDATAAKLGLVKANLDVARAFHAELDLAKRPAGVRYFFFAGTRQTTMSSVRVFTKGAGFDAERAEIEDAGDGTVPVWSAMMTGVQCQPVGGEHGEIYKARDLRRTLAVLLGKKGVLAPPPGELVEVALRERVVNPEAEVHVALTFTSALSQVDGELRVQRILLDQDDNPVGHAPPGPGQSYPIRYAGLAAEKLGLTLKAPTVRGIYRVGFFPKGAAEPAGSDKLFVQDPTP